MEKVYIGDELSLFQHAVSWKKYFGKTLQAFIHGDVLEVGAGMGGTTLYLLNDKVVSWTCLEPDASLSQIIEEKINTGELPEICKVVTGTLEDVQKRYHTIIYIDVIEHISDDRVELRRAHESLLPGGTLIVLVPAFQMMYSEFDKAIGHYRRYSKRKLVASAPESLQLIKLFYLDSIGLAASLVNKLLLKQSYPTPKQVRFWDSFLVPLSKLSDKILFHSFGKSLVGIWKKD